MSDEDETPAGAPMWMATFADLMSLLMCFFVLILSFSEMNVLKYKQIADSMRDAFGVQKKLKLEDVPKGTSIIAQQFAPGKPEPTILETIQQVTSDPEMNSLKVGEPTAAETEAEAVKQLLQEDQEAAARETAYAADMLRELLIEEIGAGQIDVENDARTITIRVREKGSFGSGQSGLDVSFLGVLDKISEALTQIEGRIFVEGHTDNIPINTPRYPSNWALSASRAVEVAQRMMRAGLAPDRFAVSGYADSRPQASNDSWEGRAANRRVEIIVRQPLLETQGETAEQMNEE